MSGGAVATIIVGLFFVIGVTVGVVAMIALSAVRQDRDRERPVTGPGRDDEAARAGTGASGIPGHWEGALADDPPPWPRGADSD